jgi:hypothetical protein
MYISLFPTNFIYRSQSTNASFRSHYFISQQSPELIPKTHCDVTTRQFEIYYRHKSRRWRATKLFNIVKIDYSDNAKRLLFSIPTEVPLSKHQYIKCIPGIEISIHPRASFSFDFFSSLGVFINGLI